MMESMTKRIRYNQNVNVQNGKDDWVDESEKYSSEKSQHSSSITSGESTESVTPENSTDSNSNSDDGLSIEPSRTSSNADFQTLSSRVLVPAFIKFVEGESFMLPPLSQLEPTCDSNILGMDSKLAELQNVLQQSGVEIADNSPTAVLTATYDYIMQLRSSSKQFESKLKQLQIALDKHDDVVCQAILKNVQMDALNNTVLTTNASTILASGSVDKNLDFIDASEELIKILHPEHSFEKHQEIGFEFNLLHLVEEDYRDTLRAKLALLSSSNHPDSISSYHDNNSSSESESGNSSSCVNPLYIYVTSTILAPNHNLGKRKRPCVLRITAMTTILASPTDTVAQDIEPSPSSSPSMSSNTINYSVTIFST